MGALIDVKFPTGRLGTGSNICCGTCGAEIRGIRRMVITIDPRESMLVHADVQMRVSYTGPINCEHIQAVPTSPDAPPRRPTAEESLLTAKEALRVLLDMVTGGEPIDRAWATRIIDQTGLLSCTAEGAG